MPKQSRREAASSPLERVLEPGGSSLLDVLDHVLAKGVTATGDLTLGLAGVDLIYLRLSALLAAADRVLPRVKAQQREGAKGQTRGGAKAQQRRHVKAHARGKAAASPAGSRRSGRR
ncbi:MAG: gas vesicle protein [Vicinamibacterales bacterium]